jgi:hypothetical protein
MREGEFNPLIACQQFFVHYLYGNNFSDTRDFACLLSYWDGEFLYGKTYVAALLSFIPRALIPLREEWGIAMVTNQWVGFDSAVMPGLRPGLFGEAFFNFGFLGVAFFGWLFGFVLKFADEKIKEHVHLSKDLIKGYSYTLLFSFVSVLMITGGMWTFYVFILVNFALIPFRYLGGSGKQLCGISVKEP